MTDSKKSAQMHGIISFMFDCWNNPDVHLLILKISIPGGRHSSMVSSVPTILRLWVRIPSTPSKLFSICIIEIVMRKAQQLTVY